MSRLQLSQRSYGVLQANWALLGSNIKHCVQKTYLLYAVKNSELLTRKIPDRQATLLNNRITHILISKVTPTFLASKARILEKYD